MEASIQFLRSNNVYVQNIRSIYENYEIFENVENIENVESAWSVESVESVAKKVHTTLNGIGQKIKD